MKVVSKISLSALTLLLATANVYADTNSQQAAADARDAAVEKAANKAYDAAKKGPATIELLDQATMSLPQGYLFVPAKEAAGLMEATGNTQDDDLFGLVLAANRYSNYIIAVDYHKTGYVADSEAKSWKADEMLSFIQKGTEEDNSARRDKGFPTINITGWLQAPTYDEKTHKLIWAINGVNSESYKFVNYNTYALGRDGYFELDLLSSSDKIEVNKKDAEKILSSINYNPGKRYEDYIKGTDKLAEYGIAALVTGIAAKKLGLIALAGVFMLKVWKLIVLAFVFLTGSIKKLFKRNKA